MRPERAVVQKEQGGRSSRAANRLEVTANRLKGGVDGWMAGAGRLAEPVWQHRVAGPLIRAVLAFGGLYVGLQVFLHNNEPPPGVLVIGILIGVLYALVAFGLILVYRANRIINFAQAEIGATAAVLGILLMKVDHLPYLLAFLIATIGAVASGLLVEVVVVRRFASAPRLVLSVATIGVSLVFAVVQFYLPKWLGGNYILNPAPPKTPFSFGRIRIYPLYFDANSLVIIVAAAIAAIALFAFFRATRVGIAVRAAAENADRAKLLGISTGLLSSVVWMIAAALSGLGIFLRIPITGIPVGADIGPYVLLYALSAAVIAGMESFSVAAVAGIWVGVIEQSFYYFSHNPDLGSVLMLPILLVAMLFQRRRAGRAGRASDTGVATWSMAREFRPVPPELVRAPAVTGGRILGGAAVIAVLCLLPYVTRLTQQTLASVVVIYGIVAVSLVVLTGWAGQISLGQWGLAGVGAVVASAVTIHLHADFLLTLLLAGLAGALASTVIGLPAIRIQGLYLAVATLAFGIAVQVYLMNPSYFPELFPTGIEQIARPKLYGRFSLEGPRAFYFVCLAIFALALLSARSLRRSRAGRALIAARDNERGAASFGIFIAYARLSAFAIAGFWAAVGGALFAYQAQSVSGADFDPSISLLLLTIVVLGGVTSLPGAVLGTAFIGLLKYGGLTPAAQNLASGVGVLIVLFIAPGGVAQAFYSARDGLLRYLAIRRGIVVPSLVADTDTAPAPEPLPALAGTAEVPAADVGSPV